jgi:hypothetical protein
MCPYVPFTFPFVKSRFNGLYVPFSEATLVMSTRRVATIGCVSAHRPCHPEAGEIRACPKERAPVLSGSPGESRRHRSACLFKDGASSRSANGNSSKSRSRGEQRIGDEAFASPVAARPGRPPPTEGPYASTRCPTWSRAHCSAGPSGSRTRVSAGDFSPRSVSCSARLRMNCRPSPWPGIQTW